MDCDMLCRGDIAELMYGADDYPVLVRKYHHVPDNDTKFLGQKQTKYMRKNWSSLMVMNCTQLPMLTKHIVNTMTPALWFHQFGFIEDDQIGDLPEGWNRLIDVDAADPAIDKLVHFTNGGPWHGYNDVDYADEWWDEYNAMVQGGNPVNYQEIRNGPDPVKERHANEQ